MFLLLFLSGRSLTLETMRSMVCTLPDLICWWLLNYSPFFLVCIYGISMYTWIGCVGLGCCWYSIEMLSFSASLVCFRWQCTDQCGPSYLSGSDIAAYLRWMLYPADDNHSHVRSRQPTLLLLLLLFRWLLSTRTLDRIIHTCTDGNALLLVVFLSGLLLPSVNTRLKVSILFWVGDVLLIVLHSDFIYKFCLVISECFLFFFYREYYSGECVPAHLPGGDIDQCLPILPCPPDDNHTHVRRFHNPNMPEMYKLWLLYHWLIRRQKMFNYFPLYNACTCEHRRKEVYLVILCATCHVCMYVCKVAGSDRCILFPVCLLASISCIVLYCIVC